MLHNLSLTLQMRCFSFYKQYVTLVYFTFITISCKYRHIAVWLQATTHT